MAYPAQSIKCIPQQLHNNIETNIIAAYSVNDTIADLSSPTFTNSQNSPCCFGPHVQLCVLLITVHVEPTPIQGEGLHGVMGSDVSNFNSVCSDS